MAVKIPRNRIGTTLILLFIVLAVFLGGIEILGKVNEKNATLYSATSKSGDPVYADIVSIVPESATIDARYAATTKAHKGFFCSCETVDGKTFEAYIDTYDFDRYIQRAELSWSYIMPKKVVFSTPLRINGSVSTRKNILSSSNDVSRLFYIKKSDRSTY